MTEIAYGVQGLLLENLGEQGVIELLTFTLPLIKERKRLLLQHLQAGDWEVAARLAHKTLGSIRLYGSAELESLLQQIRQQELPTIATSAFQTTFDAVFSGIIQTLTDWLAAHSVSTQ